MNQPPRTVDIKALDKKLSEYKSNKKGEYPKKLKFTNDGWRMVIELVTGMLLGISIGIALDFLFVTQPIFLIFFSIIGFLAGVKTMLNTAKKMNETHD